MMTFLRSLLVVILAAFSLSAADPERAPELRKSSVWINSAPLTLKALRGKVVLVDFWAFDCAPCIETVPLIEKLHQRYGKDGLVVLGIHAPRTKDEADPAKLRAAVSRMGITYPVVADNQLEMWKDYRCDLWPTQFVIDQEGTIRYHRGGTARLADLDEAIRTLTKS